MPQLRGIHQLCAVGLAMVILQVPDPSRVGTGPTAYLPGPGLHAIFLYCLLYIYGDLTYSLDGDRTFSTPGPFFQLTAAAGT